MVLVFNGNQDLRSESLKHIAKIGFLLGKKRISVHKVNKHCTGVRSHNCMIIIIHYSN